ncbi:uncharacterized protein LOC131234760 isoform X2 [Magnolia sinica]|uniref:uncharacterized protein LOC131234760 isoform X2 n=1 Tax=Magnolia sinica TaxID=86752 RepID=UPI00265A25E9|nr:uncharacterized protein LOC131234760 isoform X2 [Magnolia sinica]
MAENFRRWESDPLFSAAEVVQDSADRMMSIYRMLLHDQSLLQGDPSDPKLLSSVDYHRRDLATALGTTKWQLEDFERAVNSSALLDRSGLREDAISRYKQLVRAIREQIILVEKSIENSSAGDLDQNMPWVNLNEQDRDGFALFLSGADSTDHPVHYDSESSIMRRFLDSAAASSYDEKSDEIVELKIEEPEHSKMNGIEHLDQAFDSFKDNKLRKVGSRSARLGFESSVSLQVLTGDRECESSFTSSGGRDLEVGTSKNRSKGSCSRLDIFGFLNKFWLASGSKMARSFTKRRKDGEVMDDCIFDVERSHLTSALDASQADQGKPTRLGFSFDGSRNAMQSSSHLGAFRRIFQRLQYIVRYSRVPLRLALVIFASLILLGLLFFRAA